MIRLVGSLLLTGGSAMLGFSAVRHMDQRLGELYGLLAGLEVMAEELEGYGAAMPQILKRAAQSCTGRSAEFFCLCARGAEHLNGRTFQQVWQQAMEAAQLRLEQEERQVLEQLGAMLGRYDAQSQKTALDRAASRLEQLLCQGKQLRERQGRVYLALGMTAGAFLLILLI